jgi:hypothetical protein
MVTEALIYRASYLAINLGDDEVAEILVEKGVSPEDAFLAAIAGRMLGEYSLFDDEETKP